MGKPMRKFERWYFYVIVMLIIDIFAVSFPYFVALYLKYDRAVDNIPLEYLNVWKYFTPIYIIVCLGVFSFSKLYSCIWGRVSFSEIRKLILSSGATWLIYLLSTYLLFGGLPTDCYIVGGMLQFLLMFFARFSYQIFRTKANTVNAEKNKFNIMIVGGGAAGCMLLRDIHSSNEYGGRVCCIIDDDSNIWHRYIDGVPIVGGREDILLNVKKYEIDKIYFAIPSASLQQKRDILNICKEADCELKTLPGLYELASDSVGIDTIKDVKVEDLLGRDTIKVNMEEIYQYISGKVILVTGGGGSIGSELCRQIAAHNPKQLIVFDIYENSAHEIGLEIRDRFPLVDLKVLIGSVRDSSRLNDIFSTYKPQIVFHAAAHKHVPLMEDSPRESIKNNALGTYKTAYAAMKNGVERFVLISTDKAVNPTNIMGASKRICEMIVQLFDKKSKNGTAYDLPTFGIHSKQYPIPKDYMPKTDFVSVRFGNVLGSNGSVIPRFKQQIERGGPVTVTHPDIIRYFMTIPEAVSLVLQAGTYAKGGEIFVLDMGEPVKIDTLARNMIKLNGLRPDIDIKIEYIGLRPGEKLFEEKLMAEEGLKTTQNNLIHVGQPLEFDENDFLKKLIELDISAYGEEKGIKRKVAELIPTYHPDNSSLEND